MIKIFVTLLIFLVYSFFLYGQKSSSTDSLVEIIMKDQTTPEGDQGLSLIKSGDYESANKFLSNEINKDESDRAAYFKRGVANWALSDTLSACRDWSSVLALGDTEMFNLLESKCHSSMIIEDDTIPAKQYKKMWSQKSGDASASQNAKTVVDEMPAFPGGENKMFEYVSSNLRKPKNGKHGTVYVNFLINPKGKIMYPYVTRGIGGEYDKEAMRLIRNMPAWKPGKQKGKAVYVRSNLPVRF